MTSIAARETLNDHHGGGGLEVVEVLERDMYIQPTLDASADPYAGTEADNGKIILTPQEAADNLNRHGVNFTFGNYGALDDGVLTYGFWTYEEFLESYYFELRYDDGTAFNDDAYYAEAFGAFEAFTAEQEALAEISLGLWSDLIDVEFVRADSASEADITFASVYMSPAAGAHAYYPQAEALDDYYGTTSYGQISGDVWTNWLYPEDFTDVAPGDYGLFALTHELGHSLGLAHGGDYNASDGNPITYVDDAYFFQDSQQYTIMSYFAGSATGAGWVDWNTLTFRMPSTPMVHDIMAVQDVYGSNAETRTGDTIYGFNSTADNPVFDFTVNTAPVLTIYDAGGIDTLDVSGWDANAIIDLNEGAFSSASDGITLEELKAVGFLPETYTQAQLQGLFASYNTGSQGQMYDNIAIAYGTVIENAVGGSGDDVITGNAADNNLDGGAGDDELRGGAGSDRLNGGEGSDIFALDAGARQGGDADLALDFASDEDRLRIENATGRGITYLQAAASTLIYSDGVLIGNVLNTDVDAAADAALYDGPVSAIAIVQSNLEVELRNVDADTIAFEQVGADTVITVNGEVLFTIPQADAETILRQTTFSGEPAQVLLNGSDELVTQGTNHSDVLAGIVGLENTIFGGNGTDTINGSNRDDHLYGQNGDDLLLGGAGDDALFGDRGDDVLHGESGDDWLDGGKGNDTLVGGGGSDNLRGDKGNDTFVFVDADVDSGIDTIIDFARSDRVDVSQIDADVTTAQNHETFTWIGSQNFSGTAGELRSWSEGGVNYLGGDVDGDGQADLLIVTNALLRADDILFA